MPRRSHRARPAVRALTPLGSFALRIPATCVALIALAGCGAADDAPAPEQVAVESPCPPLRDLAPATFELLESKRLETLRTLLGERIDDAQLSAVLDMVFTVLEALSPDDLRALFALTDHPALDRLAPLLDDLVRWLAGDPDVPASFQTALVADVRRLVGTCDTRAILGVIETAATTPELPALLDGLGAVLALDLVQQVLGAGEALDREGFTVLVCNILASVTRPGFSVQGDIIEPLSGIDLLPLDEPPIAPFLRDLDTVLDPQGPLLPVFADLVCCDVYGVRQCSALAPDADPLPRDPVFTWAMHDLFTGGVIDIEAALATLGQVVDDPSIGEALAPLDVVLDRLLGDRELKATLDRLLLMTLEPETARGVLHELLLLVDAGALDELRALVDAVVDGCDPMAYRDEAMP